MPLKYKVDILAALKVKGYTSYRLINEKLFSSGSVQKLREGEMLSSDGIAKLCELLKCQPGDIIEYSDDETAADESGAGED